MPIKTQSEEPPALNLTPMIDVVFLLIIFFMVGTKFADLERNIDLQVPQVSQHGALTEAPAERIVNVYADGVIMFEGEKTTLNLLTNRLRQLRNQYPELGVVVRGDGAASYQYVAEVFNACKQAGVAELGMSVRIAANTR